MPLPDAVTLAARYRTARNRRQPWESLWRDCYGFAMPQRDGASHGPRSAERLFDGTAPDAVDQLAASLLAELTPPWAQWFGLIPGTEVPNGETGALTEALDVVTRTAQGHFDRSNFAVEMHQCFLDLVTIGTATLMFQETAPGEASAFRFTAVPALEMAIEEDDAGQVRTHFRTTGLSLGGLHARYPGAIVPPSALDLAERDPTQRLPIVEAVVPDTGGYSYAAMLAENVGDAGGELLAQGRFEESPFLTFRWTKGPGELYGRSPVMTALPDIKTANKVVELVLKNASIAVTGIWLADDDGVINPANIRLVPGAIIPKAVGSAGLTPLAAPGRFDVSELMLADLRGRIRHTLLADRLAPVADARMTATEVVERSQQMTRLLGAIFGRLQVELLTPLIRRALHILARRGEIPAIALDGRQVMLQHRSPLARVQARDDVQNTLLWLETVGRLGAEAATTVDTEAAARWLGRMLGVPGELIRDAPPPFDKPDAAAARKVIDHAAR